MRAGNRCGSLPTSLVGHQGRFAAERSSGYRQQASQHSWPRHIRTVAQRTLSQGLSLHAPAPAGGSIAGIPRCHCVGPCPRSHLTHGRSFGIGLLPYRRVTGFGNVMGPQGRSLPQDPRHLAVDIQSGSQARKFNLTGRPSRQRIVACWYAAEDQPPVRDPARRARGKAVAVRWVVAPQQVHFAAVFEHAVAERLQLVADRRRVEPAHERLARRGDDLVQGGRRMRRGVGWTARPATPGRCREDEFAARRGGRCDRAQGRDVGARGSGTSSPRATRRNRLRQRQARAAQHRGQVLGRQVGGDEARRRRPRRAARGHRTAA